MIAVAATAAGCDPSPANDRAAALEELDEIERMNFRHRAPILESEAVGCDVCPTICRWEDLHIVPPDELFRDYRELAAHWGDYTAGGALQRIACIAKRHPDPAVKERFLGYLWDSLDTIRYATAVTALERGIGQEQAMESLRDLARGDAFGLGGYAWGSLQYWRGRLGITLRERRARQRATHKPGAARRRP